MCYDVKCHKCKQARAKFPKSQSRRIFRLSSTNDTTVELNIHAKCTQYRRCCLSVAQNDEENANTRTHCLSALVSDESAELVATECPVARSIATFLYYFLGVYGWHVTHTPRR